MTTVGTFWETVRHLRPVQFYGRLWLLLHRPKLDTTTATPAMRSPSGPWIRPPEGTPRMLGPRHFRFLNQEHQLPVQGGWNDQAMDKLWLYNLHYFDDLQARDAHLRSVWQHALMLRWIDENPPTVGNGWEPYPVSLRIVNWCQWLLAGNSPPPGCIRSLALQARWLARRLEWHLLGNHLFANAKALVFAGLLFKGAEAAQWLARGLDIVRAQLAEQVLRDGGNFERSTMYHAIFLKDVLDLLNVSHVWPDRIDGTTREYWIDTAQRMLAWLFGMSHPDGEIALFNDAAFDVAPNPSALARYAQKIGVSVVPRERAPPPALHLRHWKDSGYLRMCSAKAVAILDVAPVGPDYLPGHAHADTLSFELSVRGQRVVVNGGTSRYGLGPDRIRERQTVSHSTVEIAGQSSSHVWGGFRVGRRAHPMGLHVGEDARGLQVACSHDGYRHLPGRPVHRRTWQMDEAGLEIADAVTGGTAHRAIARYLLHPAVRVQKHVRGWKLTLPEGGGAWVRVVAGHAQLEPAHYAPEFGKVQPTQCLAITLGDGHARTQWAWI